MNEVDFQQRWLEAEPRLRAGLLRKMQEADVDDVLQMTAMEALVTEKAFTSQDHFTNWCRRVATNKKIDDVRKYKRECVGELPIVADSRDIGDEVVARVKLAAVQDAIDSVLPPAERAAIREAGQPEPDRAVANRKGVARMRGREKLRPIYESAACAPLRAASTAARRALGALGSNPSAAAAAAAAAAIAAASFFAPSTRSEQDRRSSAADSPRAALSPYKLLRTRPAITRVSEEVRTALVAEERAASAFLNYTPIPPMAIPFVPAPDGSRQWIVLRPTREEDQGNLNCGQVLIFPDQCIKSPLPSIDTLFWEGFPRPVQNDPDRVVLEESS